MKIHHNIALAVTESAKNDFLTLGIYLEHGFSNFKIDESDVRWTEVKKLAKRHEAIDTATSSFTKKELKAADHLVMEATWHHGYPEPSDDAGYLQDVYDLSGYCDNCGKGLVQKNSFSLSKEPKWGAKQVLQINWVFDEFFVKPELWESVFRPFGVEYRNVLHVKSGKQLETVVQLVIPDEEVSLSLADYPLETCMLCHSKKYIHIDRGYFPALKEVVGSPIFKPCDLFGSGRESHKAVVISRDLYSSISTNKLKGVTFVPMKN